MIIDEVSSDGQPIANVAVVDWLIVIRPNVRYLPKPRPKVHSFVRDDRILIEVGMFELHISDTAGDAFAVRRVIFYKNFNGAREGSL